MTWPHLGKAATVLVAASTEIGQYFGPLLADAAQTDISIKSHFLEREFISQVVFTEPLLLLS